MSAELANTWRELGQFDEAAALYAQAIENSDAKASLKSVEHHANLLCRLVDRQWYAFIASGEAIDANKQMERVAQLRKSSDRLQWLIAVAKTPERLSLRARIQKSLALIEDSVEGRQAALAEASRLYREASELDIANGNPRDNYSTFNWLACEWLGQLASVPAKPLPAEGRTGKKGAQPEPVNLNFPFEQYLDECVQTAQAKLSTKEDFAVRVTFPDELLLRSLLKGILLARKDEIIAAYQKAFATGARPSEVDSVLSQIDFIRSMISRQTDGQKALVATLHEIKVTLLAGLR